MFTVMDHLSKACFKSMHVSVFSDCIEMCKKQWLPGCNTITNILESLFTTLYHAN